MNDERPMLSRAQLEEIVNRLAWRRVEAEEQVHYEYGVDREDIPRLMAMHSYEWDAESEVWASTRSVWSGDQQ